MKPLSLALIASTWLPFSAHAIDYNQFQAGQSSIQFAYTQMGVAMDGQFRRFNAQLNFDPARASTAQAAFEVDTGSVDTGSGEADQEVLGKAWFDSRLFPTARFVSSSVKPLGGNRYEVAGKLSIKGRTQDIIVPASVSTQGNRAVFDGSFTIRRGDFAVGEGSWAKFDIVANDVRIKFRITASAGNGSSK